MFRFVLIASLAVSWATSVFAADTRNVSRSGGDEFRRVALVVGNNDYANITKLKNARQDAIAMAATFRSLGFEVIEKLDVGQRDLKAAVRELESRLNKKSIGVFFYAGHGIQVKGNNYLLPVDIPYPENEREIEDEAIELNQTLLNISKASKFTMFIVDACRDKPIQFKDTRDAGGGGLAKPTVPDGVVVLYSAGAGQKALDSLGAKDTNPNGLFTRELLRQIKTPGLPVAELAQNVYESVKAQAASINHEQTPGIYTQSSRFALVPGTMPTTSASTVSSSAPGPLEVELEYWRTAEKTNTKESYQAYLQKYPSGQFASLAQDGLKKLKNISKTSEECWRDAAVADISPTDKEEFVNACLAGREFKVVKTSHECFVEARNNGIPTGAEQIRYVNACQYGKSLPKIAAVKSFQDCLAEVKPQRPTSDWDEAQRRRAELKAFLDKCAGSSR